MDATARAAAFPNDFVWGAATSSYQIEGAVNEDGRAPSIWDTFSHTPGKITNNDTGDVACDHYHRYREDVELMAQIGVTGYRFSIAWPRILPTGTGAVNQAGLDFYDRLVDALLAKRITPYATLYHWDLPQALQDAGGWPSRSIIDAFANYADVVSRRLGDRVHNWMTINEPWVISYLGYGTPEHAPGANSLPDFLKTAHNLNVAHGKSVSVLRANGNAQTRVGIVLNLNWVDAATDSAEDEAAAQRFDGFLNRWYLDPIFKGAYPADMVSYYSAQLPMPGIESSDMQTISAPLDFLGINYYTRSVISSGANGWPTFLQTLPRQPQGEYTEMGWEVYPDGLYKLLMRLTKDYAPAAMYITENGAAFADELTPDGKVHDPRRVAYLQSHLNAVNRAIRDGAPMRGYFVWSFMDNFEWGFGYTKRFGITYVDYATQRRILKDSGAWYADVIRQNAVPLG